MSELTIEELLRENAELRTENAALMSCVAKQGKPHTGLSFTPAEIEFHGIRLARLCKAFEVRNVDGADAPHFLFSVTGTIVGEALRLLDRERELNKQKYLHAGCMMLGKGEASGVKIYRAKPPKSYDPEYWDVHQLYVQGKPGLQEELSREPA